MVPCTTLTGQEGERDLGLEGALQKTTSKGNKSHGLVSFGMCVWELCVPWPRGSLSDADLACVSVIMVGLLSLRALVTCWFFVCLVMAAGNFS